MENLEARVVEKLISIGYKEKIAHLTAGDLMASTLIREPLVKWIETGKETDCVYEEFSAFRLMRERRHKYPGALVAIAWLHRDPETARKALTSGMHIIERSKKWENDVLPY